MAVSIVARNARSIIDERGLKQRAVAEKAGLNENQLSALLCGRKTMKDVDIAAIAEALGVTPNDLFGLDQQEMN